MHMIAALYRFTTLDKLNSLKAELRDRCEAGDLKGTLLLADEGINGTVAGSESALRAFLSWLSEDPRMEGLSLKISWAEESPFRSMKVRIKNEIVTMGLEEIDPRQGVGQYVRPKDWNALISDPDVVTIDTRNTYESDIGSFKGAVLPETKGFRDFPEWIREEAKLPKNKKIAMFCTGGIRCEKATAFLLAEGYQDVLHLEGGILKYLEEVPPENSLWEGDCFVFDERVSVDHQLHPGDHVMCPACGRAIDAIGRAENAYREGVSCLGCVDETTATQKARFAERQRQVDLAEERGELHLGASFPNQRLPGESPSPTGPILYSFRRCPYAMRARMALASAGISCRIREVVLRDKPPSLLEYSPKATVPVLVLESGKVLDESLDIMQWALEQKDPESWLRPSFGERDDMLALIQQSDGDFKHHLDRYKYAVRYDDVDPIEHRDLAEQFLKQLDERLGEHTYLFGDHISLADIAIAPFIRQFANADSDWFQNADYEHLNAWLSEFVEAPRFLQCMKKYKQWYAGNKAIYFPEAAD